MRSAIRLALAAAALAVLPGPAGAQSDQQVGALTGTLKKARETGAVTIGYREASIPFSFKSASGEPIGYSIQICRALVDAIGIGVDRELTIKWVPVTPETRINAVMSGEVDLECGSTTSNLERQKQVAFSPIIFVAGTKLLVKKGSPITSFRNLKDKKVVVTAGTTNEKAMRDLGEKFKVPFTLVTRPDHAQSFAELSSGAVDAFALDDVLLYGLVAQNKAQGAYTVVGEFLSYDPYGIMFRKGDEMLANTVNAAFGQLGEDGEFERMYNRWFLRKLPSGASLDLPMSPQLIEIFKSFAEKPQ